MANTPRPGGAWQDGVSPITAAELNRIEGNTADAASRIGTVEGKSILNTDTTGAAVGKVVAVTGINPTTYGPRTLAELGGGGGAAENGYLKSKVRNILGLGDSMWQGNQDSTGYGLGIHLGAALGDNVIITNRGQGGYTSTEVAISAGAIDPVVGAFTIAADTSQVAVTVTSPTADFRPTGSGITYAWVGTLAGVPGTLRHSNTDGTWTFARTTAGSTVAVSAGSTFHCTRDDGLRDNMAIIWVGRNNTTTPSRVVADINAMIARLSPTVKRVLVLSVVTTTSETSGTSSYNEVIALNTALAAAYDDRYLDVRRYLIDSGLSVCRLTATSQDNTAIAADTVPPSLKFTDGTHLNKFGYGAVAQAVTDRLVALGWVIDKPAPVPITVVPNLFTDPDFELGTATFDKAASNCTMTRSTAASRRGGYGVRALFSGSGFTGARFDFYKTGVDASTPHSGALWVRPSKDVTLKPQIMIFNNDMATFVTGQYNAPGKLCPAGQWTRLAIDGTVVGAGNIVAVSAANDSQVWNAGDYLDVDSQYMVDGSTAPPQY